jgi:hypothetical protein
MLPRMLDTSTTEPSAEAGESDERNPLKDALAAMVTRRIKEAQDARSASGIEEVWEEDADQYDGIDALSATAKGVKDASKAPRENESQDGRSKVFVNITKPKTDAAVARVQEMLVPHDDKPWDIEPTPIPELDTADSNQVLTLGDGTKATADQVAAAVKFKAAQKADAMERWIEDQFVEGRVYAEMRRIIRDAGRLGTGCIKGPFPVVRESKKWSLTGGAAVLQVVEKTSPTSKRVDIRDFWPDPACGECIHDGAYCVERDYITARQLRRLAKLEDYDSAAIAAALKEGPQRPARDYKRFRDQDGEMVSESEVFELYYYYGDVEPEALIALGVAPDAMDEEALYLGSVAAIVTMLNGRPIKAAVNPLETGDFPYDLFPWEPVEGQPWGRSVPRKMATAQRMLNAATRAMLENAGVSAGPQVAISNTLTPVDGKYGITGRKLWRFTPSEFTSDIRAAMQVWTIPSVQQELDAIIQRAEKWADDLTNLPMLLQGQQGTAPELLGGMQMLMANANAPLRVIAKQFDDSVVVPHLTRYYDWGMQQGPDEAKGDLQIKAKGSTALVQREIGREFLTNLLQLKDDESLRINPAKLGAEWAKSYGFSLPSVQFTEDEWKAIQEQKAGQPAPQDPRIMAAQIKAEVDRERLAQDKAESELDRAHEAAIKRVEFQIQSLEFAGQREISLEQLKALLATEAIKSRDKRDLFVAERALKMDPSNPTNQGL